MSEQELEAEQESEDEYGGYEYEYEVGVGSPPSKPVEMGREDSSAFEFEDNDAIPSPLPPSANDEDGRFDNVPVISADDSYNDFSQYATDNFISSLLEEDDFMSPASVSSPVFLGPSVNLDDPEANTPTAPLSSRPVVVGRSTLPTLPASEADPILMNGNVLEPSTHLHCGPSPTTNETPSSPFNARSIGRSTSSSSITSTSSHPEAHAHQSGPLPDPFLTVSTVQRLFSPPSKSKTKGGLGFGLPSDEDGVPYGRSHHAERQHAVKQLRMGEPAQSLAEDDAEAEVNLTEEVEDQSVTGTNEMEEPREEPENRGSLIASRGLRLPEVDVFGEKKSIQETEEQVCLAVLPSFSGWSIADAFFSFVVPDLASVGI